MIIPEELDVMPLEEVPEEPPLLDPPPEVHCPNAIGGSASRFTHLGLLFKHVGSNPAEHVNVLFWQHVGAPEVHVAQGAATQ